MTGAGTALCPRGRGGFGLFFINPFLRVARIFSRAEMIKEPLTGEGEVR